MLAIGLTRLSSRLSSARELDLQPGPDLSIAEDQSCCSTHIAAPDPPDGISRSPSVIVLIRRIAFQFRYFTVAY